MRDSWDGIGNPMLEGPLSDERVDNLLNILNALVHITVGNGKVAPSLS